MWAHDAWTASSTWESTPPTLSNEFQRYTRKYSISSIGNDANYVYAFYVQVYGASNAILEMKNIQISKTNENYEPYYNYELCKIDTYQDYIYKNNGNWYKHTNICKHDTWDVIDSKAVYSATIRPQFLLNEPTNVTNRQYTLSNYFQNQINNNDVEHIFIGTGNPGNVYNGLNVFISKSRATTNTEVINWLTNNNVVVYYVPANPLDVQITETALINQLEEINKVIGQGGTVVIETESEEENAPLIVSASALKNFENS